MPRSIENLHTYYSNFNPSLCLFHEDVPSKILPNIIRLFSRRRFAATAFPKFQPTNSIINSLHQLKFRERLSSCAETFLNLPEAESILAG